MDILTRRGDSFILHLERPNDFMVKEYGYYFQVAQEYLDYAFLTPEQR